MASDGSGSTWPSSAVPPDSLLVSDVPVEIRDLRAGTKLRSEKEHADYADGEVGGEHKNGSAKAYFQNDFPTKRPDDETLLDEDDGGRLLVKPGTKVMYFYDPATDSWPAVTIDATAIADASIPGSKLEKGAVGIAMPYLVIQEVRTTGTAGGTFTAGTWTTRTLNTTITDAGGLLVSLSANVFKLSAGRYRIRASAPANQCNGHQVRLYNVTSSSVVINGTSQFSGQTSGCNARSEVFAEFYISGATSFRLEHRCQDTKTSNGLGAPCTSGSSEVYSSVEIWRL